jgi:uncharacterized protein (TIGR04255 family)
MVIKEIFPNPTVKEVVFEIRFPSLFYIENKIGDFQIRIIEEFPNSNLLYRRQILFADLGPKAKFEPPEEAGAKIWEFKSDKPYSLNVTSNSLYIVSEHHKTYNLEGGDKFRDAIKFALDNFLEVTAIPIINRVGLRYIDECPLPSKNNETFRSYYNSVFPIDRFNIADANEMLFRTAVKRGNYNLIYMETLQKQKDDYKLILDFDGFAEKVKSEDYLSVADRLHEIISDEYERTIKEPVIEYMKRGTSNAK